MTSFISFSEKEMVGLPSVAESELRSRDSNGSLPHQSRFVKSCELWLLANFVIASSDQLFFPLLCSLPLAMPWSCLHAKPNFFSFLSTKQKEKNNSTQKHLSVLFEAATVIIQGERRNETKRREQLSGWKKTRSAARSLARAIHLSLANTNKVSRFSPLSDRAQRSTWTDVLKLIHFLHKIKLSFFAIVAN